MSLSDKSMVMKFDRELRELVFGKGGTTVRRVERDCGAKVRIDRNDCTITAFGTQEAVTKVKAVYGDMLQSFAGRGFQMNVDRSMAPVIIGPRGSTVYGIQNSTDTIINVNDGCVTIRGSKEGQQAAKAMIEDLLRNGGDGASMPPQQYRERREPREPRQYQQRAPYQREPQAPQAPAVNPGTEVVYFPTVLSTNLTRRAPDDSMIPLERVKANHPGIHAVDLDRRAGTITISGEKPAVQAGAAAMAAIVEGLKQKIGEIGPIAPTSIGLIIGSGGATISELQRRHRADINVSRDTQMVTIFCRDGPEAVQAVIADIEALVAGERMPSKMY